MLKKVPAPASYAALLFLAILLVFFIYRVSFLIAFALPELDGPSVREAFLSSLRLDLSAAAILLIPVVLLSLPLFLRPGRRAFTRLPGAAGVLLFTFAFVISVTSFIFYGERRKPLEEDFFVFMGTDIIPGFAGAFDAHPLLMLLSLLFLIVLAFLLLRLSNRILSSPAGGPSSTPGGLFSFLIMLAVLLLLARGLRSQPLRSGQVLKSPNVLVNHVAINPVFSIFIDGLASWLDRGTYYFYGEEEAVERTRRLLRTGEEAFYDDRYPLLRRAESGRGEDLRNIVILQLEGFSNGFIGHRRQGREVTPFLNRLTERSFSFPFFVQNVRFTHRALFVINSGYLDRATGRSVLRAPEIRHSYSSLGRILKEKGYSLLYVEGGNSDYKEMRGFLEMEGYSVFDGPVMDRSGRYDDIGDGKDAFGYHDEYAFSEALYRLRRAEQPFLGYIMLHSTHSPWEPPSHFENPFEKPYGVFAYVDWAVGKFFEGLEESGLLENTVVVITADHTSLPVRDLSHFDRMNIPLIIHGTGLEPAVKRTIGSQVDILPTVLGLLGLDVPYASMGRDLLQVPEDGGFACSLYNGYAFWHEGDVILQDWFGEGIPPRLFERDRPQREERDVAGERRDLVDGMQLRLRSYYQTARTLSLQDRVFPRP
jgi:phosphoglycerol transferase MdoB-like AlkP superfamily enzyme